MREFLNHRRPIEFLRCRIRPLSEPFSALLPCGLACQIAVGKAQRAVDGTRPRDIAANGQFAPEGMSFASEPFNVQLDTGLVEPKAIAAFIKGLELGSRPLHHVVAHLWFTRG